MNSNFISIVIPAKNAQDTVSKCLESVLNLKYPDFEIIVVNDGSTDNTQNILAGYKGIKVLNTPGVGPSKARNIGIGQAKGEFVAFTDADCVLEPNWLSELSRGFVGDEVAGVGGIQKSPEDDSSFAKAIYDFLRTFGFIAGYMKSGTKLRETAHNPACNVMYRKSILLESGGFQENLWPAEDVELDYKLRKKGYKLLFNPKAQVYHYRAQTLSGFLKMMFRYGYSQGVLIRKYGVFRRLHLVPCILLLFLLLSAISPSVSTAVLFAGISAIFVIAIARSRRPLSTTLLGLLALVAWNTGCALGIFRRINAAITK
jgi:glycosyltransferase involved in cell wall biosynthesis